MKKGERSRKVRALLKVVRNIFVNEELLKPEDWKWNEMKNLRVRSSDSIMKLRNLMIETQILDVKNKIKYDNMTSKTKLKTTI